jgi:hypothetical protein
MAVTARPRGLSCRGLVEELAGRNFEEVGEGGDFVDVERDAAVEPAAECSVGEAEPVGDVGAAQLGPG